MASGSSTNSNVSRLRQEDEYLKKGNQGSALSAIAREFGIGKVTVADIKKARERSYVFCMLMHKVVYSNLEKGCVVRRADDDAFHRAMHIVQTYLV